MYSVASEAVAGALRVNETPAGKIEGADCVGGGCDDLSQFAIGEGELVDLPGTGGVLFSGEEDAGGVEGDAGVSGGGEVGEKRGCGAVVDEEQACALREALRSVECGERIVRGGGGDDDVCADGL